MSIMKLRCFLFSLHFCNFLFAVAILFVLPFSGSIAFFLAAGDGTFASLGSFLARIYQQISKTEWTSVAKTSFLVFGDDDDDGSAHLLPLHKMVMTLQFQILFPSYHLVSRMVAFLCPLSCNEKIFLLPPFKNSPSRGLVVRVQIISFYDFFGKCRHTSSGEWKIFSSKSGPLWHFTFSG